jgi:flagellar hook-associated protein 3 FlgL
MLRFESVSTLVLSSISRNSVATSQLRLAEAQREANTGRHHDVGLALGAKTGIDLKLRLQLSEITQGQELASQASVRAETTQSALQSISDLASGFLSMLTGARGAEGGQKIAADHARASIGSLTSLVNVTLGGQYLFGGLNTDTPPLRDFADGPQAAISSAFASSFGFMPSDPAVSGISALDMQNFVNGTLGSVFSPAEWETNWSSSTSANMRQRLGSGETVDASTNANAPFVPKLAQAFSIMMALGQNKLSDAAFTATVDKAISLVAEAQLDLGTEQARIGIVEQRIAASSGAMEKRKASVTEAIRALEAVDPYEAATRVNTLMTQLETSYAITGRISRLSLLSHI